MGRVNHAGEIVYYIDRGLCQIEVGIDYRISGSYSRATRYEPEEKPDLEWHITWFSMDIYNDNSDIVYQDFNGIYSGNMQCRKNAHMDNVDIIERFLDEKDNDTIFDMCWKDYDDAERFG